jgi:sulfate adenylyltransferase
MVNKPYGGKLINRVLSEKAKNKILKDIAELPKISIDRPAALDAEKIAVGGFSPLEGFLGSEEYNSVLFKETLLNGLPWTIPIIFAPNPQEKSTIDKLKSGSEIALFYQEKPIGMLHLEEKYSFSKKELAKQVFGTTDIAHPDVKKIENMGDVILSGKIDLLERFSPKDEFTPKETRADSKNDSGKPSSCSKLETLLMLPTNIFKDVLWKLVDGLFIHPVVGELKPDDFPPEAVVESYRYLIDNYYPASRVFLSPFSIAMRYAGPKAAVFLAIVRKNYGCTHFIVGRDMAGVGSYYDPYEAQALLRKLDIGIEPMAFRESYYCSRCQSVASEKTCAHKPENHVKISGTQLRKLIAAKTRPPAEIMRPEIADLLSKYSANLQKAT